MTYSEILKSNDELRLKLQHQNEYNILVLSTIVVNQQKEILECALREQGINASVTIGEYDNILQESSSKLNQDAIIIFWEAANFIEGLSYRADLLSAAKLQDIVIKVKAEITSVLKNLSEIPVVIFNTFSSMPFTNNYLRKNAFEELCHVLNTFILEIAPPNLVIVNIDKIYATLSLEKSIDWRYWYSSKSLYSVDFFKSYADFTKPIFLSITGKAKKALFLDCDNTIWKGIVGEDGLNGISLSSNTKGGTVYEEVQSLAAFLSTKGVIIGLVSKNNPEDVEEVLTTHSDMTLKNDYLAIKMINWDNKPENVKQIVRILNIGMDSCVFIDDSDFEVNYMQEQNPEITVLKVPSKSYLYPAMVRESIPLFFSLNTSKEDNTRVGMYKSEHLRNEKKSSFDSIDDYLTSLDMCMNLYMDEEDLSSRLAQMTQKTNQFNLTTKRYSESEIIEFIQSDRYVVIAFGLKDKFGDTGITGLCILKKKGRMSKWIAC